MSILVYIEAINGNFKKAAYELCNYGCKLAESMSTQCIALTNADSSVAQKLSNYGADKIVNFSHEALHDSKMMTKLISDFAKANDASVVILADNSRGKSLLGRIATRMDGSVVSSVTTLPDLTNQFAVDKSLFSGKSVGTFQMVSNFKIISVSRNSIGVQEISKPSNVETFDASSYSSDVSLVETTRVQGTVPLPEAELVVSAGRGMKGPENWGIIEELAETLGATTACSRPVSDSGWRPHHEHVGQTGIAIKPNLYIAIGISGAIQHLAGVNNSKTIVVINKDSEAPFFKAADYGVVADLFDVVPRLNESLKKFKEG